MTLDVQEFEGRPGQERVLRVRWVIRELDDRHGPWSGQSLIRRPLSGSGIEALVVAHDEAIGLLADGIASRVAELAAERRDAGESDSDASEPSDG